MSKKQNKTIYVSDTELKSSENDSFGHEFFAHAITDSIYDTKPPFIIGVFGGWGTGKSSLLSMIQEKIEERQTCVSYLVQPKIVSAKIDAWRYSNSDNLNRAFLVGITKELHNSNEAAKLNRKLYFKESFDELSEPASFANAKNDSNEAQQILRLSNSTRRYFLSSFLLVAIVIFFFGIVFLPLVIAEYNAYGGGSTGISLGVFIQSNFLDGPLVSMVLGILALPFLISALPIYLEKFSDHFLFPSINYSREAIDADEQLGEEFTRVIEKKLGKSHKDSGKLVIFVDNLDRLSRAKLIEALESMKTFVHNKQCVFVVACDDEILRETIDQKPGEGRGSDISGLSGEHYLDKFFQQTFRLPTYMDIDLHVYAREAFQTTQLYDEFKSTKGGETYINNLLNIILPYDISSPRKVKRIINEFISFYLVAKLKEDAGSGDGDEMRYLRPGALTSHLTVIGRLATIRSEYPKFYLEITKNPGLLEAITNQIRAQVKTKRTNFSSIPELARIYPLNGNQNNLELIQSLAGYLSKTANHTVQDIRPFIWLSENKLTLKLSFEDQQKLRLSLENNILSEFEELIQKAIDDATDREKALLDLMDSALALIRYRLPEGSEGRSDALNIIAPHIQLLEKGISIDFANTLMGMIGNQNSSEIQDQTIMHLLALVSNYENAQHLSEVKKSLVSKIKQPVLIKSIDFENISEVDALITTQAQIFLGLFRYNTSFHIGEVLQLLVTWLIQVNDPQKQAVLLQEDTIDKVPAYYINLLFEWLVGQHPVKLSDQPEIELSLYEIIYKYIINRFTIEDEAVGEYKLQRIFSQEQSKEEDKEIFTNTLIDLLHVLPVYDDQELSIKFWEDLQSLLASFSNYLDFHRISIEIREITEHIPESVIPHIISEYLCSITRYLKDDESEFHKNIEYFRRELYFIENLLDRRLENNLTVEEKNIIALSFSELFELEVEYDELSGFITQLRNKERDFANPFLTGILKYLQSISKEDTQTFTGALLGTFLRKLNGTLSKDFYIELTKIFQTIFFGSRVDIILETIDVVTQLSEIDMPIKIFTSGFEVWEEDDTYEFLNHDLLLAHLEYWRIGASHNYFSINAVLSIVKAIIPTIFGNNDTAKTFIDILRKNSVKISADFKQEIGLLITQHFGNLNFLDEGGNSYEIFSLELIAGWIETKDDEMYQPFFDKVNEVKGRDLKTSACLYQKHWEKFTHQQIVDYIHFLYTTLDFNSDDRYIKDILIGIFEAQNSSERYELAYKLLERLRPHGSNYPIHSFRSISNLLPSKEIDQARQEHINKLSKSSNAPEIESLLKFLEETYFFRASNVKAIVEAFSLLLRGDDNQRRLAITYFGGCIQPYHKERRLRSELRRDYLCPALSQAFNNESDPNTKNKIESLQRRYCRWLLFDE